MRRGCEFYVTGSNWNEISKKIENIQSEFIVIEKNYSIDVTITTELYGFLAKIKLEYDEDISNNITL